MRNEKTQNSNNNYNDRQAKLSYDHRDSEDVVMTEANIDYFENNRRYSNLETSEHKRSCRQKTEWNFTIPSETVDKDEGYINVKIPKKRLEIALAEHLSPDNTTRKTRSPPSLSSDDCPCNQQHRHHHYYHQYQYHHYHYHHPYYHYGQPVSYNNMIPLAYCSEISDNNAINIEIGHLDAPITTSPDHHDNKTDTTLIELNNGNSAKTPLPTSSTSPFTTGKKRTRAATKDDDDNGERKKCNHSHYKCTIIKKPKRLNKK